MNNNKLAVVYLAAGMSKRMGGHKLSLPLGDMTIGSMVLEKVVKAGVGHVFVVVSAGDTLGWIHSSLLKEPLRKNWTAVRCREAEKGMSYSLKRGLLAATQAKPAGFLVLLADQPFLSIETIQLMVEQFFKQSQEGKETSFLAASFQGIPRPPIIFFPSALTSLFALKGDEGARKLLQRGILDGVLIDCKNESDFIDIDTMEDYLNIKGAVHKS